MAKGEKNQNKIAIVDINKIVAKSTQVRELKAEQAQKIKDLNLWLTGVKVDIESRTNQQEKQALLDAYNREFAEKQNVINANYSEKLQTIEKYINEKVQGEATNRGFDMVLSKYIVLFGGEDITDEVMSVIE